MKGKIEKINTININILNEKIQSYVDLKKATFDNGIYTIDLKNIGYNKLLGTGKPLKYKITVKYATKKAIEKIKSSGEIILENVPVEHDTGKSS